MCQELSFQLLQSCVTLEHQPTWPLGPGHQGMSPMQIVCNCWLRHLESIVGEACSPASEKQENVLTMCSCGLYQCSKRVHFLFAHADFRLGMGECCAYSCSPAPSHGAGECHNHLCSQALAREPCDHSHSPTPAKEQGLLQMPIPSGLSKWHDAHPFPVQQGSERLPHLKSPTCANRLCGECNSSVCAPLFWQNVSTVSHHSSQCSQISKRVSLTYNLDVFQTLVFTEFWVSKTTCKPSKRRILVFL